MLVTKAITVQYVVSLSMLVASQDVLMASLTTLTPDLEQAGIQYCAKQTTLTSPSLLSEAVF